MATFAQTLQEEARRCHDAGLRSSFWWRDDDLVAPSENLKRLASLTRDHPVRCLTAVIPALCQDALGETLVDMPGLVICQHGYSHENHEPDGQLKCEFGPERPIDGVYDEVSGGFRTLTRLFGPRFAPVFVGPWNRCAPKFGAVLVDVGFRGWSGFAAEPMRPSHPKLRSIDTHADVVAWTARPRLQPLEAISARLADALATLRVAAEQRPRRGSPGDDAEILPPVGVLTHHRVLDEEAWTLLSELFAAISELPGAEWADPADLFGV